MSKVVDIKAQIFDVIVKQENLQAQIQQLQQSKMELLKQLDGEEAKAKSAGDSDKPAD